MFIDTVVTSRSEFDLIDDETGLFSDPPDALLAAVAWESGDDEVTVVHVWESAGARGRFAAENVLPLVEAGQVTSKPENLTPYRVFIRS